MMRVIVAILAFLSSACFEDGPLPGSGTDLFGPAADSYVWKADVQTFTDSGTNEVTRPGFPCTTDAQCTSRPQSDKCAGPLRCINWECQADRSQGVSCAQPTDPCQANTCNPLTGVCELAMKDTCVCKPTGTIKCGQYREFSTSDAGTTNVLSDYPCGPPVGLSSERVWIFEADKTEPVKFALNSEEFGGIWVIGYSGTECLTASCIAGGKTGVAFMAQAGYKYAVVVEQPASTAAFAKMTAYCSLDGEVDCSDGIDDNFDGKVDCADASCANKDACPANNEVNCSDGADNDQDGKPDCADEDCVEDAWCTEICIMDFEAECGTVDARVSAEYAADVTNYTCGPEAGGYDVIYRFSSNTSTQIVVNLKTDVESMGLYALVDQGQGCKPSNCFNFNKKQLIFPNQFGQVTYLIVDAAKNKGGYYEISFNCN
jgi:hypothetical protein